MDILRFLIHRYKYLRFKEYKEKHDRKKEYARLIKFQRYVSGITHILGEPLKFIDGPSCGFIFNELFNEQIYRFPAETSTPYIIDAGANIGLSVIYFKQLFPRAEIVAFEPDKNIFKVLTDNVASFALHDVTMINKALWEKEITLRFFGEGADAGRIANELDSVKVTEVEAVSLRPYLENRKVDLLKIDIEGAEITVLRDCADLLGNVERLFVEYHSFVNKDQQLPDLLNILKGSGFRLNISSPGLKSKSPFVKIETYAGMDFQLNIYAFRN